MPKKDITGQRFGTLVALEPTDKRDASQSVIWKCQCDCGNIYEASVGALRKRKSCGCQRYQKLIENNHSRIKDITNQKFGLLTALYPNGKDNNKSIVWHCKCDCGNECDVSGHDLRTGNTKSCGCQRNKSYGENKIKEILNQNNINFISEYKPINHNLPFEPRFDFYLPDYNVLIEYDGIQHFNQGNGQYDNEEKFKITQEHDKIKNQWCKDNNIPLIRIPYTRYKELCLEDLLLETSQFIIRVD